MKKGEKGKEGDRGGNKLILGIVIGVVAVAVIGVIYFLVTDNSVGVDDEDINILAEKIYFNNSEVHQNVGNDFPGTSIPVYDSAYCETKFKQKYGKDADECSIKSIRTFSRLNPLITEVECVCSS